MKRLSISLIILCVTLPPNAQAQSNSVSLDIGSGMFQLAFREEMVKQVDYSFNPDNGFIKLQVYWAEASSDKKRSWRKQLERDLNAFEIVNDAMIEIDKSKPYTKYYVFIREGWELREMTANQKHIATFRILKKDDFPVAGNQNPTPPPPGDTDDEGFGEDPPTYEPGNSSTPNKVRGSVDPEPRTQAPGDRPAPNMEPNQEDTSRPNTRPSAEKACMTCLTINSLRYSFDYFDSNDLADQIIYDRRAPATIARSLGGNWRLPNADEIDALVRHMKEGTDTFSLPGKKLYVDEPPLAGPKYPTLSVDEAYATKSEMIDPGDLAYFVVVQ